MKSKKKKSGGINSCPRAASRTSFASPLASCPIAQQSDLLHVVIETLATSVPGTPSLLAWFEATRGICVVLSYVNEVSALEATISSSASAAQLLSCVNGVLVLEATNGSSASAA
ncbi:hypothetical protein Hte_002552 [Hypoxylon texense]